MTYAATYQYFDPFVKFFYVGEDSTKFSVLKNIIDITSSHGLSKSEDAIITLDLVIEQYSNNKISIKEAKKLVESGRELLSIFEFIIDTLDKKEIDDPIAIKTIENFHIILEKVKEINSTLVMFIEIDEAKKEIKNGKIVSHKKMLSYVQG